MSLFRKAKGDRMTNPDMAWTDDLLWWDVPVAADGGEDHIGSPSTLRAYVGFQSGTATPVAVMLRNTDGRPVTPAQWRKAKTSELIEACRDGLRIAAEIGSLSPDVFAALTRLFTGTPAEALTSDARAEAAALRAALSDDPKPKARKYPPGHYRRVADIYNAAVESDPQPVQAVRKAMRHEGFPELPETTVRGWIRTARDRGYITKRARISRVQAKGEQE